MRYLLDERSGNFTYELYSDKFVFHVIELNKLEYATEEEKRKELYHWARMFVADRWEDVCMEAKGNPYREAAREELEKIKKDEIERWIYLREEMADMDERSRLRSAESKGRKEGIRASVQMCKSMGVSKEKTCENLQQFYSLSEKDSLKMVEKYWFSEEI